MVPVPSIPMTVDCFIFSRFSAVIFLTNAMTPKIIETGAAENSDRRKRHQPHV
jgi:hypothetical protein